MRASAACSAPPRIPLSSRKSSTSPPRASRDRSRPARNAKRHREHREVRDPDHDLRPRPLDQVGDEQPHEQRHAAGAGDAGQHRPSPRRRRRPPAHSDHHADGDVGADEQDALHGVERVGDGLVREDEQQIVRLLQEQHRDDVEDQHRQDEHTDDQAVDRRFEPPSRDEGQDQRGERDRPQVLEYLAEREREGPVELAEQRPDEQAEPRRRHQQAAAAVRPAPPGDQPARREGSTDQAVQDVRRYDRGVAREQDRHQCPELRRDHEGPHDDPEARARTRSREAV